MSRDQAKTRLQILVATHGLRWGAAVPAEAYDEMAEINKVLTEDDRREALGLPARTRPMLRQA